MSVEKLLLYTNVDKAQIINDLLLKIEECQNELEAAKELVTVSGQIAKASIEGLVKSHKESLEALKAEHAEHLEQINEICAEAIIMVRCTKCGNDYELPCDVSEFDPHYSYCGKGGPSPCTP